MKRRDVELDPELAALFQFRRTNRRAPANVRARALARGRAIIAERGAVPVAAAGAARPTFPVAESLSPTPIAGLRGGGLVRAAAVASIALVVGAIGAIAALRGRTPAPPALPASPRSVRVVRDDSVGDIAGEAAPALPRAPTVRPARPAHKLNSADPLTDELELLQRAQAAYTRRDFSAALTFVAEHARRFPSGHLAEEREALRVRLLARMGRAGAAKRAAADFTARFPRSVFLARIQEALEDLQ